MPTKRVRRTRNFQPPIELQPWQWNFILHGTDCDGHGLAGLIFQGTDPYEHRSRWGRGLTWFRAWKEVAGSPVVAKFRKETGKVPFAEQLIAQGRRANAEES
jgi:hypothetical protein